MIEYLLKITVAPFKSNQQQENILEKIMRAISDMGYVGSCEEFYFKRGISNANPKYKVPKKKKPPQVFEEAEANKNEHI